MGTRTEALTVKCPPIERGSAATSYWVRSRWRDHGIAERPAGRRKEDMKQSSRKSRLDSRREHGRNRCSRAGL
ncbi:MAG: hypothetical protein JWN14_4898 [Chthonomonadales bacterium]|nr:hypothetical protein [Chthonomonadales bacterium]